MKKNQGGKKSEIFVGGNLTIEQKKINKKRQNILTLNKKIDLLYNEVSNLTLYTSF